MTRRLTSVSNMAKALSDFFSRFERHTILITQPAFIWSTGEKQEPNIVLYEGDANLVDNRVIDDRLLKARRIVFIGTAPDKGTIKIDFTARTVAMYLSSPDVIRSLTSFKEQILKEARSKWITAAGAWGIFFVPLLALAADLFVDALVNPRIRHDWLGRPQGKRFYPGPDHLAYSIATFIGLVAIVATLAAVIVALIVARSGPLRIWPEAFTSDAFQQVGYRLRSAIIENTATIIVGVFCAIIGAIVAALLTK